MIISRLAALPLCLVAVLGIAVALSAAAQSQVISDTECTELNLRGCGDDAGLTIKKVIYNAALTLLALISTISFLFIIYCGAQYIMAAGDSSRAQRAKTCLLYAAIGLIVSGMAGIITNVVINLGKVTR